MVKASEAVRKETKYIAYFCIALSMLMQAVFIVLKKWDYTVILGNILSLFIAVGNFYLMGITVQKALEMEQADAKKLMKASQSMRNFGMLILLVIGVVLPYFNTIATIVPVFFPRISISLLPVIKGKEQKEVKNK